MSSGDAIAPRVSTTQELLPLQCGAQFNDYVTVEFVRSGLAELTQHAWPQMDGEGRDGTPPPLFAGSPPAKRTPFAPYAVSAAYPQAASEPPTSFLSSLFRDRARHTSSSSVLSDTEQAFTVASDSVLTEYMLDERRRLSHSLSPTPVSVVPAAVLSFSPPTSQTTSAAPLSARATPPSAAARAAESLRPEAQPSPPRSLASSKHLSSESLRSGTPEADRNASPSPSHKDEGEGTRLRRFRKILAEDAVADLVALRKLAWSGVPERYRAISWKLMLGILPANRERRAEALERKRREYKESVAKHYRTEESSEADQAVLRQIRLDIPRTATDIPLFREPVVQKCMERILYTWAVRHPASSYVQGMNDLVTPFFVTYLFESREIWASCDGKNFPPLDELPLSAVEGAEADAYWSISKFLDCIQDNYVPSQPGIQRFLFKMKEVVRRIDESLAVHLEKENCDYMLFAFRWMNCLLMRELPLPAIIRIWDTYLSEGSDFGLFHVYVCASLLLHWAAKLKLMDFQGMILFLQELPTSTWKSAEVDLLLSQAFLYQSLFQNSPSHLKSGGLP